MTTTPDRVRACTPGRTLPLPPGFGPESVAVGAEPVAFVSSLADGRIRRVDLVTGHGEDLRGPRGTASAGLALDDRGRLFVAGAFGLDAFVLDTATGAELAHYDLDAGEPSLVADVTLAAGSAWFTDARRPVLHRVPLGPGGALPGPDAVETIPLPIEYGDGFNCCGIAPAPDGRSVVLLQANTGRLVRVADRGPDAGAVDDVALTGGPLTDGDGLLLRGRTLLVARGFANVLASVELAADGSRARVRGELSDPGFDVPTAVAEHRGVLVVVNARFSVTRTPETRYELLTVEAATPA